MRPASKARRPASTPSFIASAIFSASSAAAIAVFIRTPSAPSSIARAASEAVPTPASTIQRYFGDSFAQDSQIRHVLDSEARPDGRGERHHCGCTRVDQAAGVDQIVVRIGKDDEPFLHQHPRGFEQSGVIGEESLLVADDFELDPVGKADLAAEARGTDGVVRGVATGRVRKNKHALAIDVVEQGFLGAVGEVDTADGDGHYFSARGGMAARHLLKIPVFSRTDEEAGTEGTTSDNQRHISILEGHIGPRYMSNWRILCCTMEPEVGVMQIPQHFQTANIFSGPDILVVLGIAVLLFGGKKLPELAKGLGEGIKSFKEAVKEDSTPAAAPAATPAAEPKKQE